MRSNEALQHAASTYGCEQNVSTTGPEHHGLMRMLETANPGLKREMEALTEETRSEIQRAGSAEEKQALLAILAAVITNVERQDAASRPTTVSGQGAARNPLVLSGT